MKKGGTLEAGHAWFVGNRWPLPSKAALAANVYHVGHARRTGAIYWPASGLDANGKAVYFYPDGALIPKEAVKANRGYSRWIIAPSLTCVASFWAFLAGLRTAYAGYEGEATAIMIIVPPLGFALGYAIGWVIDAQWGARRVQNKWLKEHPAFTAPF